MGRKRYETVPPAPAALASARRQEELVDELAGIAVDGLRPMRPAQRLRFLRALLRAYCRACGDAARLCDGRCVKKG